MQHKGIDFLSSCVFMSANGLSGTNALIERVSKEMFKYIERSAIAGNCFLLCTPLPRSPLRFDPLIDAVDLLHISWIGC